MTLTYLLIALIAMFGHSEDFLGTTLMSRPLVLGPLVGLVLGDLEQGVIIGATLELIFMGNIKVGAAIPPDVITGGVLGTAFAIISGKGPTIALAIAVPVSILAELLISSIFVFRAVLNKRFNQYAGEGNFSGIQRLHILSGALRPAFMGVLTLLALQLGGPVMKSFLDMIPAWAQAGLTVAGNMLPALGFALLLNLMFNKNVAHYFFLGFILAAYVKLPVIAIGALGVIIAVLATRAVQKPVDDDEDFSPAAVPDIQQANKLTHRDIRNVFLRSMALEANFNFETWQNTGFAFSIIPVLKRLYKNKEEMAVALKRHLSFFNTSPYGSTLILGITAAMEGKNSGDPGFDAESINALKLGLMGPLAGVFDSLFWGTFKVIAAGVGTSLAIKGNIAGPILFLLIFNVPHLVLRYKLAFIGYRAGNRFLQDLAKNNVMDRLSKGATILGLTVIGAMPATLMSIHTPIRIGTGKSSVSLQSILDHVVPSVIPLGLTFLVYYFVKNGTKTTHLLSGLLILGFIGSIIQIFV